jgi:hypothetical protein
MSARRTDLMDFPNWPRLLSREQAASYLGITAAHFGAHVANQVRSVAIGRRVLFDRMSLDIWVDRQVGDWQPLQPHHRWLEALDGDSHQGR